MSVVFQKILYIEKLEINYTPKPFFTVKKYIHLSVLNLWTGLAIVHMAE